MTYGPSQRLVTEQLDVDTCTRLLARGGVGRIGFVRGRDVIVLPVNYVFDQGAVVFRTQPGAKFEAALHRARVAFEIDGEDAPGEHFSVLVNGVAQEVWDRVELQRIESLPLWSVTTADHGDVVRVAPSSISGRRLRHEPAAVTLLLEESAPEVAR